jgi:hypothetical protein
MVLKKALLDCKVCMYACVRVHVWEASQFKLVSYIYIYIYIYMRTHIL